jgi:hypothetical protein
VYWVVVGSVGGLLLAGMVGLRLRGRMSIAVALLGAPAVAALFTATYTALGQA